MEHIQGGAARQSNRLFECLALRIGHELGGMVSMPDRVHTDTIQGRTEGR